MQPSAADLRLAAFPAEWQQSSLVCGRTAAPTQSALVTHTNALTVNRHSASRLVPLTSGGRRCQRVRGNELCRRLSLNSGKNSVLIALIHASKLPSFRQNLTLQIKCGSHWINQAKEIRRIASQRILTRNSDQECGIKCRQNGKR